uniref:Uncharacterized protein MANES_01G152900 n=1 Tax=Rhizophora mucronata TaxID=61149 RepID=A0A2P2Q789_RHIMU
MDTSTEKLPSTSPTTTTGVSLKTARRAINALLKWRAEKSKTQKPQLLEEDEFVYLVLSLKKIPQKGDGLRRINAHKISLPNPLINSPDDNSQLCLVIDDRPKSGLSKDAAKKKIENESIPISKIIKISKLKTDYRPFESKRKLCDSFDLFLADKRVIPVLPKLLGKQFFKKKKIPVGVDLKHQNWKEQIERVCRSALLFLGTGTCSVVKIGKVSMNREDIVKNVVAAINGIADMVPRKWDGIRSLHLKLLDSLALPLYQAVPDLKLKIETSKEENEMVVGAFGSKENKEAKTEKNNKKKKGRIHEVMYMDNKLDWDENLDHDELGTDNAGEINGGYESDEMGGGDLESNKRKKGVKGNWESSVKKLSKLEGEDGKKLKQKRDEVKNEDGLKPRKKQKQDVLKLKNGEEKLKDKSLKKKRLAA